MRIVKGIRGCRKTREKSLKGSNVIAQGKRSATLGLRIKPLNVAIRAVFEKQRKPSDVNLISLCLKK